MSDDQLLAAIRAGTRRTNIQDVDLTSLLAQPPEHALAYVLAQSRPLSQKSFAVNFDPAQNLFLESLVTQEVLEKRVIVKAEDFFKAIVALDYAATIFFNEYTVFDELLSTAQAMERQDRSLDPTLEVVAQCIALHYLDQERRSMTTYVPARPGVQRYERINQQIDTQYAHLRRVSPMYAAEATMILSAIADPRIREHVQHMNSVYDIKAALFVDTMLGYVQDEPAKASIIHELMSNNCYNASLIAITTMSKEMVTQRMDARIRALQQR